jgi:CTP:molybdopterin cytidylyltransferase MocA
MVDPRICALIPAAGKGSRLGLGPAVPKLLVEIVPGVTLWDVLRARLGPVVDHIHVVVSPAGAAMFSRAADPDIVTGFVSASVQEIPRGMGDAIVGCSDEWTEYDTLLIVWGDQVNLSRDTVDRVLQTHASGAPSGRRVTIPVVPMTEPYVEYEFDEDRLVSVRQSREGDPCRPGGLSDVGMFCLSADGLLDAWRGYTAEATTGTATGEVNFLPFLPYLSRLGWSVSTVAVADPDEARGVNTMADLEFARVNFAGV